MMGAAIACYQSSKILSAHEALRKLSGRELKEKLRKTTVEKDAWAIAMISSVRSRRAIDQMLGNW